MIQLLTTPWVKRCAVGGALLWTFAANAVIEANTANEAELDSVRGLGPAATALILQARERGNFQSWQDLMQLVKGIKRSRAEKLSEAGLTVNGEALNPLPQTKPAQ